MTKQDMFDSNDMVQYVIVALQHAWRRILISILTNMLCLSVISIIIYSDEKQDINLDSFL